MSLEYYSAVQYCSSKAQPHLDNITVARASSCSYNAERKTPVSRLLTNCAELASIGSLCRQILTHFRHRLGSAYGAGSACVFGVVPLSLHL
jgi:hypothetical protein